MSPVVVMLALVGFFTIVAFVISFLAGFIAGAHRRLGRRVAKAFSGTAYGVEHLFVSIFKTGYYVVRGHKWEERHYHH